MGSYRKTYKNSHNNISIEKQTQVLDLINRAKLYKVDLKTGEVYYWVMSKKEWRLKAKVDRGSYLDYRLMIKSEVIHIPAHAIVWLAGKGEIDQTARVYHRNGDYKDNRLENLSLKGKKADKKELKKMAPPKPQKQPTKDVRYPEVQKIRRLLETEPGITIKEISQRLWTKYGSTRYAVMAIQKGIKLKYDHPGPYLSPNSKLIRHRSLMINANDHLRNK